METIKVGEGLSKGGTLNNPVNPIVMLPTYNERQNIAIMIPRILSLNPEIKIVVVDDSSPDGTAEEVRRLMKDNPNRIYLLLRKERGRASAGLAGFRYALAKGADCIIEMDADFSHDPGYLPVFLEQIKYYDIVIGSRYVRGGASRKCSQLMGFLSRWANRLNRFILGLEMRDSSGGFKCYRRQVLEQILKNDFISTGYSIGAELLYYAAREGFGFKEIPIIFRNRFRGSSKINWKIILNYPLVVWRLRLSAIRRGLGSV